MIQKYGNPDKKGSSSLQSGLPKSEVGFEFHLILNRTQLYVIQGAHTLIEKACATTKRTPTNIGVVRDIVSGMDNLMVTQPHAHEWEFAFTRLQIVELISMFGSLINVATVSPNALDIATTAQAESTINVFTDVYDTLRWGAIGQMPGAARA